MLRDDLREDQALIDLSYVNGLDWELGSLRFEVESQCSKACFMSYFTERGITCKNIQNDP